MLISGQEAPRLLLLLVQSNNLNQRRTPIVSSVLAIFWLNSFHGKYSSLDGKCLDSYELKLSTKLILHRYWNSLKLWWNRLWIADGFLPLLSDCWKMNRSQSILNLRLDMSFWFSFAIVKVDCSFWRCNLLLIILC